MTPRLRRGYSVETRRRRGRDVDIPRRWVASPPRSGDKVARLIRYTRCQDYGHSNLWDALVLIKNVVNVTLRGGGTIDGGGEVTYKEPPSNMGFPKPTKLIAVVSSRNVTVEGSGRKRLRLRRGGWISLLLNNATGAIVRDVKVDAQRDGVNVVSSTAVVIERCLVRGGSDDAIAIKTDAALGAVLEARDVVVRDSIVQSVKCNGLQIGSETVGDVTDVRFANVTVLGAAKAGIGIVSMDGARASRRADVAFKRVVAPPRRRRGACGARAFLNTSAEHVCDRAQVSNVVYENVTMRDVQAAFFIMVGARLRRPGVFKNTTNVDGLVGSISDVAASGITATRVGFQETWKGYGYNYSAASPGERHYSRRPSSILVRGVGASIREPAAAPRPHPTDDLRQPRGIIRLRRHRNPALRTLVELTAGTSTASRRRGGPRASGPPRPRNISAKSRTASGRALYSETCRWKSSEAPTRKGASGRRRTIQSRTSPATWDRARATAPSCARRKTWCWRTGTFESRLRTRGPRSSSTASSAAA